MATEGSCVPVKVYMLNKAKTTEGRLWEQQWSWSLSSLGYDRRVFILTSKLQNTTQHMKIEEPWKVAEELLSTLPAAAVRATPNMTKAPFQMFSPEIRQAAQHTEHQAWQNPFSHHCGVLFLFSSPCLLPYCKFPHCWTHLWFLAALLRRPLIGDGADCITKPTHHTHTIIHRLTCSVTPTHLHANLHNSTLSTLSTPPDAPLRINYSPLMLPVLQPNS